MRHKGLDLNLLVALDVLIEERSVSRAAEQLNMSQPAMSAALGRLRRYFDDPILSAHGKRMIPTGHALMLKPMLRDLLGGIDGMLSLATSFDPLHSRRHFRIGASDYLATVLFNTLAADLQAGAPGITIEIVQPFDAQVAMLEQGDLDILLTPAEHVSPDHPEEHLMDEAYVVAGCGDNPVFDQGLTEEAFFAAGHLVVEIGRMNRTSFAETHLRPYGARRRVEVRAASFLLAPELLVGTDRLSVMQERLATIFSRRMNLRYAPMPFAFPIMREILQYHGTRADDPGLRWMINKIKAAASHLES